MYRRLPIVCLVFTLCLNAESPDIEGVHNRQIISGNPAATNVEVGTGQLGQWIGIPKDSGLRLGGVFVTDVNWLISGGA